MTHLARSIAVLSLITLSGANSAARAGILQSVTTLPPPAGAYLLPLVCITPVCLVNAQVSGFEVVTSILSSGNQSVSTNTTFSAQLFQNSGGIPGAPLGVLSVPGTMDFTYFGRMSSTSLGSFNATIDDFLFIGVFNGHTFQLRQNPLLVSSGVTSIDLAPGGQFRVDSFFDVFAELSIDGGPFIPGPLRDTTLTGVPEPGATAIGGLALFALCAIAARARAPHRSH